MENIIFWICGNKEQVNYSQYVRGAGKVRIVNVEVLSLNLDIFRLAEYQSLKYEELKMNGVCLEGHEGFFRGYCKHDYRPINDIICYLPASLRALKFVNKSLYLASRNYSINITSHPKF